MKIHPQNCRNTLGKLKDVKIYWKQNFVIVFLTSYKDRPEQTPENAYTNPNP